MTILLRTSVPRCVIEELLVTCYKCNKLLSTYKSTNQTSIRRCSQQNRIVVKVTLLFAVICRKSVWRTRNIISAFDKTLKISRYLISYLIKYTLIWWEIYKFYSALQICAQNCVRNYMSHVSNCQICFRKLIFQVNGIFFDKTLNFYQKKFFFYTKAINNIQKN